MLKLFAKYNVLSKVELHSRYEVYTEGYETTIMIEGELSLEMAKTMILPVAIKQQTLISENILNLKKIGVSAGVAVQKERLEVIGKLIDGLCLSAAKLEKTVASDATAKIISAMKELRKSVDGLEKEVDDSIWPLPKYGEMLFIY